MVYAKEAFGSPASALEYLGRYTHKIAIGNHRILAVDEKEVTFSYLDRKANCKKTCTLPGEKFIARFLLHVLPKGYTPRGMPMAQDPPLCLFCHEGKNKGSATDQGEVGDAQCATAKIHRQGRADDHQMDRPLGMQYLWQRNIGDCSRKSTAKGFAFATKSQPRAVKVVKTSTGRPGPGMQDSCAPAAKTN